MDTPPTSAPTLSAIAFLLLVSTGLLASTVLPSGAQELSSFELDGARVAVYNLAGTVEVVRHDGPTVRVEVRKRGPDGSRLDVAVDRIGGRESLRILYPADRIVYPEIGGSRIDIDVADDGTFRDGDGGWPLGWWSDDVEIRGSGRGLEAWADVRVLVPAGRDVETYLGAGASVVDGVDADLRVKSGIGDVRTRGTRGALSVDTGSGGVTVRDARGEVLVDTGSGAVVLEEIAGNAMVDTGSGRVSVRGVTGDLSIDTGSGGVELSGVEGRRIVVDTGSGSVEGSELSAESLLVDTGSGSVRIHGIASRDIEVDTGSGSVSIGLRGPVGDIRVDTGSGGVELRLPADADAMVQAEAGSGGFDSDLPMELETRRRGYVSGRLGEGRGRIQVDTGSGTVRIRGS